MKGPESARVPLATGHERPVHTSFTLCSRPVMMVCVADTALLHPPLKLPVTLG